MSSFIITNDPCGKNGSYKWPENSGCIGRVTTDIKHSGDILDRFGSEDGKFFGSANDYYTLRSVPYFGIYQNKSDCVDKIKNSYKNYFKSHPDEYNMYRFKKKYYMSTCTIAPEFGYPGGGTQFWSDKSVKELLDERIIEKVRVDHIPFFDENDYNDHYGITNNGGKKKKHTLRNKNKCRKYTRKNTRRKTKK